MADVINNENVATEEDLSEQRIIRREKLKALQDDGRDPFVITKYDVTHLSTEAIALFEEKEATLSEGEEITDFVFDENVSLRKSKRGDLLTIKSAGAYGSSMASQYNMHELPKAVYSDHIIEK